MSDGPEPPLDYRNADDDRKPFDRGAFLAGVLCGIVSVGCAGASFAPIHIAPLRGPRVLHPWLLQAVVFAVVATLACVGFGLLLRYRRHRWTFLVGFLLAVGVTSLIEGNCIYTM